MTREEFNIHKETIEDWRSDENTRTLWDSFWDFVDENLPVEFHDELHQALTGNADLVAMEDKKDLTDLELSAQGFWWWDPAKW